MTASVTSWAATLPHRRVPVADLPEFDGLGTDERDAVQRLGIETVIDDDRFSSAELAATAAADCLASGGVSAEDIDVVLVCQSRSPAYLMSSEATYVQERVGACQAVGFTVADLGCAASSAALRLARDLLRANRAYEHVLIAMGSKPYGTRRYRPGVTISGDGGAAMLISQGQRRRLTEVDLQTSGKYWDLYRIDYRDTPSSSWVEVCTDPRRYSFQLATESRNRFRVMIDAILERHQLSLADIDHLVMQNLSQAAFAFYETIFQTPVAQACRRNLGRYGHLGSADIVVNLMAGEESGELGPGSRVLVLNNSPVAAWSVMLYEP